MLQDFIRQANKYSHKHSPFIMTAVGVAGVVTTAYLTGVASWRARGALENEAPDMPLQEKAKLTWQFYIPPAATGIATIGAIAYASRLGSRRTAAAVSAYTITERAFAQYKEKVVEQIGPHKEQVIRDDIARDTVAQKGPTEIILAGSGEVMCCEFHTRRYFMSDMETLRRAQNKVNAQINSELYVSIDEFYDLIGLQSTAHSNSLGWNSDRLMELEFSTVLSQDGRPCLAFDYNYLKPI